MGGVTYGLQDLPGGESTELDLLPLRAVTLSIGSVLVGTRFARIVLWDDAEGLHAACLDIDARPLISEKAGKTK